MADDGAANLSAINKEKHMHQIEMKGCFFHSGWWLHLFQGFVL